MPPNAVAVRTLQRPARGDAAGRPRGDADAAPAIEAAIAAIAAGRNRVGDIGRTPVTLADFGIAPPVFADAHRTGFAGSRAGVGDTTGFVAMDADGNALAMLQSVFQPLGSGAVDPGTGILLNNRMFDFSAVPGEVNAVAPGVRPSHTLNPWLVRDGRGVLAAGVSPGGVSQTTTGFQIASGAMDPRTTLGELVARPRWSLARDGTVLLEPGMPAGVAEALRARGHAVEENSRHEFYFGSAKAVRRNGNGLVEAAADHRRQATAMAW